MHCCRVLLLILSAFNRRSGVAQFTPMCTRIPKRAIKVYLENAGAACVTRKGTSCSQRSEALKAHRKDRCRLSFILPPNRLCFPLCRAIFIHAHSHNVQRTDTRFRGVIVHSASAAQMHSFSGLSYKPIASHRPTHRGAGGGAKDYAHIVTRRTGVTCCSESHRSRIAGKLH